ncbi:type II toxin-antitoxin system PemK/MazF family toxin [Lactiplantibacillus pentosus]|uniref:type II toxin-antitoxin system PemK/MazF family toxin n=1 Tax=Lactiplantibacillus pentosus TaxID=1589 RepID=UPI00132FEBA3|nr:type II toxin-antitoxin system PemK/MazF family toxin [Lactiplantibacillus pentosus]
MYEDDKALKLTQWNQTKTKYAQKAIGDEAAISARRNEIKHNGGRELCFRKAIYWADLGENIGHEQNKVRPVLVVSKNIYNRSGNIVIVPLTTAPIRNHAHLLNCWYILYKQKYPRLEKTSIVKTEAIRSISIERLTNNKYVCPSQVDILDLSPICYVNNIDWKKIQAKIKFLIN